MHSDGGLFIYISVKDQSFALNISISFMEGVTRKESLLNPMDRAAEIMFGLIMTLTFTCSISIANTHRVEIRPLLIGAIGCNLAWGLVDATMYLVGVLAQKNKNKIIF